ncbi:MAG: 2-oxoacid:acceptor oxidoreductase subunit alpha [Thermoanaerobaculia bacterium]
MSSNDLTIAITGSGGDGVVTTGDLIAQACAKVGLNVIKTEAYGPQIRGGESSCTVRISPEHLFAQADTVDLVVIFSWSDYGKFKSEIIPADGAILLYEEADPIPEGWELGRLNLIPIPFSQLAKDAGAPAGKNIMTLGLLGTLFGLPVDQLRAAVMNKFAKKKEGVTETNLKAFEAGIEHAKTVTAVSADSRLAYTPGATKLLMSGNEAAAVAAVHAGCRFFAGYPITPSSEVLHYFSEVMPKIGGTVVQTEDELSAIGAIIGGSFAGVKSMTATSGPGLSLMAEMLGLASIAEIPIVILNVQRGGPSTGNPTKSEQADLSHAIYASHGDTPRVVIAPSDVEDCFHATVDAFNIAEEFQIPVIILSDQLIGPRRETLDIATLEHEVRDRLLPKDEAVEGGYRRYADTPNGVSPMAVPGLRHGIYQTNGLEHNEQGRPSSMYETHEHMNEKRYRKFAAIGERYHFSRRYGPEKAKVGVVCWGSSKGAVKEAVTAANARGESVSAFVPQMIHPFPVKDFEAFRASVDRLLIIELSYGAQFYTYLRTLFDLPKETTRLYKRSGVKHLTVTEVEHEIRKSMSTVTRPEEVLA